MEPKEVSVIHFLCSKFILSPLYESSYCRKINLSLAEKVNVF